MVKEMDKWEEKRLGALCVDVSYGYTESATHEKIGPKFLRITDITENSINWDSVPYCKISKSDFEKYKLLYNDIVIARTGATSGYNKLFIKSIDAVYASYLIRFRIDKKNADARFVYYYLQSNAYRGFIKNYISGAAQPGISAAVLSKFRVKIPAKNIQKRIADILSAYDDLIEANNQRIKLLEQAAQELYQEWFVRFRFPGYEKVTFENGLPKEWTIKRMNEVCYVTDGTHDTPKPVDVGIPLVTGRCISNGFVDFNAAYNISEADHEKIKKRSGMKSGDIIFSNIGTVGNCCIVDYDKEFSAKNVIIFKPETTRDTAYLYYWMSSSTMQEVFASQTNGASQQFVGLTFMRNYKLLVPKKDILDAFADKVLPFIEQKRILNKNNLNLVTQRDLLLPRLMGGKLEV